MAKHWFKYISGLVLLLVVAAWALTAGAGRASAAAEPTPAPLPVIGENPHRVRAMPRRAKRKAAWCRKFRKTFQRLRPRTTRR